MELKDVFYIVGILSTFIIGLLNYLNTTKNRRNFLRELVYKEQFQILGKLNSELHILNLSLIENLKFRNDLQKNKLKILEIESIIYSNSHLLPTELITKCKELILISEEFLDLLSDELKYSFLNECYDRFNEKYWNLQQSIVKSLGVSELFNENNNLIKRSSL